MHYPPSTFSTLLMSLLGSLLLVSTPMPLMAGEPITGFRDLQFGMTPQEVSGLPACSSAQQCIYELSEKNRSFELWYMGDTTDDSALQTALKGQGTGLARISIDMGQYTENWYQQLQRILGNSYQLTQDISQEQIQAFLGKQTGELTSGYENGQVLLTITRRKFGNMILKVIYQSPQMARAFLDGTPSSSHP
jgi:hypothetical protein